MVVLLQNTSNAVRVRIAGGHNFQSFSVYTQQLPVASANSEDLLLGWDGCEVASE